MNNNIYNVLKKCEPKIIAQVIFELCLKNYPHCNMFCND